MNNQAAQTMPELPLAIASINSDGYWTTDDRRPDWKWPARQRVFSVDQMHQYARDYAAALSQPAGVPDSVIELSADLLSQCTHADALGELPDQIKGETMFLLAQSLAAAPAASGGDVARMDSIVAAYNQWPADIRKKLSLHDLRRMTGWSPPATNPPSGASVSERARELLAAEYERASYPNVARTIREGGYHWDSIRALELRAIEHALSSPRQEDGETTNYSKISISLVVEQREDGGRG